MPNQYEIARSKTSEYINKSGIENHLFYGPTTDRYWSEPLKLIAINMEPYGYEKCGHFKIDRHQLMCWIYDEGKTKTKTARYTFSMLASVLSCFQNNSFPTPAIFRENYRNKSSIEDALDRTVYYNIRSQSNSKKQQDFEAISSVGNSEEGNLVWDEILSLKPDAIFVGGLPTIVAVNGLLKNSCHVKFRGNATVGTIMIQSIPHPSRSNYNTLCEQVAQVLKWKESNLIESKF